MEFRSRYGEAFSLRVVTVRPTRGAAECCRRDTPMVARYYLPHQRLFENVYALLRCRGRSGWSWRAGHTLVPAGSLPVRCIEYVNSSNSKMWYLRRAGAC